MENYKKDILAIIPARGGSKGIPRKNIRNLAGKPLVAWTIETALKASCLNRVIVSTDDVEIARISKRYGADVPFLRPKKLANDTTPDILVYQHAIEWLEKNEMYRPEIIVWLRPTSPLRSCEDINGAVKKIIDTDADCVRSVCKAKHHPYWIFRREENDQLVTFIDGINLTDYFQRQLLPDAYFINGAVDVVKRTTIIKGDFNSGDVRGFEMEIERSIDIDNEMDFLLSEIILQKRHKL